MRNRNEMNVKTCQFLIIVRAQGLAMRGREELLRHSLAVLSSNLMEEFMTQRTVLGGK